jgi:hypothetical protein
MRAAKGRTSTARTSSKARHDYHRALRVAQRRVP